MVGYIEEGGAAGTSFSQAAPTAPTAATKTAPTKAALLAGQGRAACKPLQCAGRLSSTIEYSSRLKLLLPTSSLKLLLPTSSLKLLLPTCSFKLLLPSNTRVD